MYGLENQTRSEAIADIETALSFGVSHLSGINSRSSEIPRFGQSHRHFPMQMWLNLGRKGFANYLLDQIFINTKYRHGVEKARSLVTT